MRGRLVESVWPSDPAGYAPARHRRACRYQSFVPDPVVPYDDPLPAELAGVMADAEAAVRSLNERARPALAPLARLLLRTESIASSKVEGLQVDTRALARAEARAESGQPPGPGAAEVLANIRAMEIAIARTATASAVTTADICEIHSALMSSGGGRGLVGAPRIVQNWIGGNDYNPCGADFVPPPPELVGGLLDDLADFVGTDHLPPVVHAAIVHAQFETIHPFEDGNGRTGRALIHVVLRRRGVAPSYVPPISVVLAAERDRYIEGLEAFRAGDSELWLERFAVATARAAAVADGYLGEVADLQRRWRDRLASAANPRADAAAWAVIDALPAHPVISLSIATAATGRSTSSVAVALDQLSEAGVLVPLSDARRNRTWEVDGLTDLIARMEDGRP